MITKKHVLAEARFMTTRRQSGRAFTAIRPTLPDKALGATTTFASSLHAAEEIAMRKQLRAFLAVLLLTVPFASAWAEEDPFQETSL